MNPSISIASFFAGMAGFDLGFHRAGFETTVQCEIDTDCLSVLAKHFPGAEKVRDINAIIAVHRAMRLNRKLNYEKWKEIFELLRAATVWCGGFPCQDLSVAGLRAGLAGERSGHWFAFRRAIALFRPPWVVIENVPGLRSSNGGSDLSVLLSGLAQLGYRWAYRSFDAQYFGVPQRRERVFIVGHLADRARSVGVEDVRDERAILRLVAEVLFEPESLPWDTAPSRETGEGASAAAERGAGIDGVSRPLRSKHNASQREDSESYVPDVSYAVQAGRGGSKFGSGRHNQDTFIAFSSKDDGQGCSDKVSPTLRSMPHKDSHSNGGGQIAVAFQERGREGGRNLESQDELAYAVNSPAGGGRRNENCVAFKPSHYTRGKDGAPAPTTPPLSSDADKGDQEALIFEPRYYTRGEGGPPDQVAPSLKSDKGRGPGDARPAVAYNIHSQNSCAMKGKGEAEAALETDTARTVDSAGFTASQGGTVVKAPLPQSSRVNTEVCETLSAQTSEGRGGTDALKAMVSGGVRRLTPVECLRLQGFPDDWLDGLGLSDSAKYRMIGNAVEVDVAEWIGRRLMGKIRECLKKSG